MPASDRGATIEGRSHLRKKNIMQTELGFTKRNPRVKLIAMLLAAAFLVTAVAIAPARAKHDQGDEDEGTEAIGITSTRVIGMGTIGTRAGTNITRTSMPLRRWSTCPRRLSTGLLPRCFTCRRLRR
jgi:hypothetical protein